jgi:alpha-tubulin suppressor-like RCC1 family protein
VRGPHGCQPQRRRGRGRAAQVAALAAGDAHSAALTTNGFLFTWGSNDRGQLGLPALAEVAAQVPPRRSAQRGLAWPPRAYQNMQHGYCR